MTARPQFELQLMGRFGLRRSAPPADIPITSKNARALVAYVAMQEPMRESRERLAALLWPDRTDRMARQNLRACIASLRRDLAQSADAALLTDDETVGLSGDLIVDARRLRGIAGSDRMADLEEAARLYRGPFMGEFEPDGDAFREWVFAERAKLDAAAGTVLANLASCADAAGDGAKAIELSSRLAAIDPFREDWVRLGLRIAARHAGRDKALSQAKNFAALLKQELDVEPEAETVRLVEQIKTRRGLSPEPPNSRAEDTDRTAAPLPASGDGMTPLRPLGAHGVRAVHGHRRRPIAAGIAAAAAAVLFLVAGLSIVHEFDLRGAFSRGDGAIRVTDQSAIPLLVSGFQTQATGADPLARELTERVVADVSRFSGLTVFDGRSGAGGRGARFVATGLVQRQDAVMRASATLTDAVSGAVVWADDFSLNGDASGDPAEKVSRRIARDLQIQATYALARGLDETQLDRAPLNALIAKALTIQYRSVAAEDEAPAAALYNEVLRRDHDNALALVGLAARLVTSRANMLGGQRTGLAQAEALLDRALRSDPRIERAHYWRGNIYLARGQRELAVQSFARALDINPSFIPAEAHLGYALVLSGHAGEGLRRIQNALSESSHDPTERLWLRFAGLAQLELGEDQAAIGTLQQAASLAAPAPPLRAALASAYALAGDRTQSRAQFQLMKETANPVALDHLLARAANDDGRQRSRYLQGLWLAANDGL